MILERLSDYFEDQFGKMTVNCRLAVDLHDPEGIHDYRVCIKRLKALFPLVEGINPDFRAKRCFKKFRKLFKSSAALRDVHIQLEVAENLRKIPCFPHDEYTAFLRAEEEAAGVRFTLFSDNFDVGRLRKKGKVLAGALDGLAPADAEKRAAARLRKLIGDLTARIEDPGRGEGELHGIRMLAKEVHYVREMLGGCFPDACSADAFIAGIKEVHQALGKWHDYEVARAFLDRFAGRGGVLPDGEGNTVRGWIDIEKRGLMDAFETAWGRFREMLRSAPPTRP